MKLIQRSGENFVFHIGKREKRLRIDVLRLYPLIPVAHHRVSKTADPRQTAEHQKLLEDALAERKQENKRQLMVMLNEEQRFRETDGGYRFTLSAPQMDWLLQVLNDIRVGGWLLLGEPDEKKGKSIQVNAQNLQHYAAMEFCGLFQMTLLDALERQM